MNRGTLLILTHTSYFTNLPLAILFINKATKHYKINNMHVMSFNKFSDFMQVLYSIRKHPTNNEDFPMHILFTRIYLLQEQKLNNRNYSKQKINKRTFLHATEHVVHLHAKFGGFRFFVFLSINTPRFEL
jgi:hypothetical protein